MHFSTLSEWLNWIGKIHLSEIELGLDRVKQVAAKLDLLHPMGTVITIGGTNGKGSTVAGLEAIYLAAGYKVGAFTSPFLFEINEEIRVNGAKASNDALCQAFQQIESVRGNVSLTPFEFITLAALLIFKQSSLAVLLLEVGLGGRLDAVNIIDADVAIITSIGIDHVEWLGNTREAIAREKAGILRQGKPAISGDPNPPETLQTCAHEVGAIFYQQGKDFHYEQFNDHWSFTSADWNDNELPLPQLALQNLSMVLMAVALLQNKLPVNREAIHKALAQVKLPGRMQVKEGPPLEIYDVSHNPDAILWLKEAILRKSIKGKTYAVFSMLADKDIATCLNIIKNQIDVWYVAPLNVKREATLQQLKDIFHSVRLDKVHFFPSIKEAYAEVKHLANDDDRIIIFGSFHTVAEVLTSL